MILRHLKFRLLVIAAGCVGGRISFCFLFYLAKIKHNKLPVWDLQQTGLFCEYDDSLGSRRFIYSGACCNIMNGDL